MLSLAAGHLVGFWEVASYYSIYKDELFPEREPGGDRFYQPQDHPELPFEIAKLAEATGDEIVRFAKQWGRLGALEQAKARQRRKRLWTTPTPEYEPISGGEPLAWIRRQARDIQACVSLAESHVNQDAAAARVALRRFFAHESTSQWGWEAILRFEFFVKDIPAEPTPIERALDTIPLDVGRLILGDMTNSGMEGIEPTLEFGDKGPAVQFHFDTMLQIAYLHIARLLEEKAQIEHCEECGRAFRKMDGRQRFCPPGQFERESKCGNRHRYRKWSSADNTGKE